LLFDTKLEGRRLRRNYFEFDLVLDLFQEIDGIDFSFFDEPLATISFIDEVNKFFFQEEEASPRLRRANEIHLQVVDLIRRRESYATSIQQADQYFQGQSYQLARDAYAQARDFLPDESYPKTRIEEIDQILAQRNELDRQYNNLITDADREFTAGMLRESREKYSLASELKPAQEYPKQRISEIDRTLAQEQERHMQYNRLIRLGDESFNAQNYEAARPHYESAVTMRPAESYPADRVREIDRILSMAARLEREYNTHISRADSEFAQGRLEQSKQSYLSALEVKPSESYPRSRVEEIDRLVAERLLRDRQQAEQLAAEQRMVEERKAEEQRLEQERLAEERRQGQLRLAEQQRIERERIEEQQRIEAQRIEEERIVAEQRRAEEERLAREQERLAEERRQEQLLLAEQQRIEREGMEEQRRLEAERLERERIAAERIRLEQQRLEEEQRLEQERLAEERRLEQLRVAEQQRIQRERDEQQRLEQIRIAEVQRIERENIEQQRQEEEMRIAAQRQAEQGALDSKYNEAIQTADRAFASRVYSRAAEMYRQALSLKPQEQYPRTRLAETNRIIDQLNRESQSYTSILETADAQFNQRLYTEARVSYTRASEMRPAEQLPRQRIAEIDRLLAEELSENVRYQNAVRDGDRLFGQRQFFGSRDAYQLALSFRPDDTHSISRIIEINNLIAQSEEMAAFYARGHMDVSNVREMIRNNAEKRYYFVPFEQRRTGSYLIVNAENTSGRSISLFINYGKDIQRSGGFSVTVGSQSGVSELRINISDQVRWISEDNNWISITPVGGEVDLQSIKVHFGR
jgi:hypothetical protein